MGCVESVELKEDRARKQELIKLNQLYMEQLTEVSYRIPSLAELVHRNKNGPYMTPIYLLPFSNPFK